MTSSPVKLFLESCRNKRQSNSDVNPIEKPAVSALNDRQMESGKEPEIESYREDSDYVRESTETNSSGGSSSTSGYAAQKVRRIHRAVRNKNRGSAEIRRNPMRVSKKDKDFPRPRQRLLAARRKDELSRTEPGRRTKSSTMPYMNTRSVTRKMYNVGATYQAPTLRDETEWKEWPAHGMHERPVFHPQAGLAVEYLGRYFTSPDGLSYREIAIGRPEIEVVSVDPRSEFLAGGETGRKKRLRGTREPSSEQNFESCMHESLHCVLGYCSQVMSPGYEKRARKLNHEDRDASSTLESESRKLQKLSLQESPSLRKAKEEALSPQNYAVQQAHSQASTQVTKQIPRLFPMQTMYVGNPPRTIALTSLKSLQGGQARVQELMRTRNPLILLNASEARARLSKPIGSEVNLIKLEDTSITDETLMEMSSAYKSLASGENSSEENARKAPIGKKLELTVTKLLLGKPREKIRTTRETRENLENKDARETQVAPKSYVKGNNPTRHWSASETSEIARILSEYNKSSSKRSAIDSRACTSGQRPSTSLEGLTNFEEAGETANDRNVSIKIPQGKWRRFHLTVEKLKDLRNASKRLVRKKLVSSKEKSVKRAGGYGRGSVESPETTGQDGKTNARSLQELLEDTAVLYCAASGVHQDDLADYIDGLDAKQSTRWLDTWKDTGEREFV